VTGASGRLLLDEMFHPRIAAELTARGHLCLAVVAEPGLRESSDADLLSHAVEQNLALVTNNVADFERLRRARVAAGDPVPGLIYTSDPVFPRDRRFLGRLIAALDAACRHDALTRAGGLLWLQPAPNDAP
jgi:predicted nuclease of predicted toxin-antitoxin system